MNCHKCDRELPEGSKFCPYCAEPIESAAISEEKAAEELVTEEISEVTEEIAADAAESSMEEAAEEASEAAEEENAAAEPEEPAVKAKPKAWKIVLAVVCGVVLLAVLVGAVLYGLGIDLRPRANDILYKDNYTVTDEQVNADADKVIATIGDAQLTNGELQVYYWETVYSFLNNNYYYLSMYGLDVSLPLSEQTCFGDETKTWQQYFLENAIGSWQRYTTLQLLAKESGFSVDAEMQEFLDGLSTTLQETATSAGYETPEAWLADNCGPGVSEAGYINYVKSYYEGTAYLVNRYEELEPNDAEIEAYFTENEAAFTQNGVTKDGGKYYDVRHILIEVEGGTEAEDGTVTYSDAEWEACRAEAQKLLDEWKAGEATEDTFAELATLYSADGGSSTNGGLYSQLTAEENFVEPFKNWYLDETRAVGDTGLVQSTYGYHIMYFSGSQDIWHYTAAEQLLAERISQLIEAGMEAHPIKTNYKKIVLGNKEIS